MPAHISYTAAYAEMAHYTARGIQALQQRAPETAIQHFQRALQLSNDARLGPRAVIGSKRNLAIAYRASGQLTRAESLLRELLSEPELTDAERPFVLHEIGTTLALAGAPEAPAMLAGALALYDSREDILLCALDLADAWLARGGADQAYDLLARTLRSDDESAHPDLFCHLQLVQARSALASHRLDLADRHLQICARILPTVAAPILRSLHLAVTAEREFTAGHCDSARALSVQALEQGLIQTELETGDVFRTIALVFRRIWHGEDS